MCTGARDNDNDRAINLLSNITSAPPLPHFPFRTVQPPPKIYRTLSRCVRLRATSHAHVIYIFIRLKLNTQDSFTDRCSFVKFIEKFSKWWSDLFIDLFSVQWTYSVKNPTRTKIWEKTSRVSYTLKFWKKMEFYSSLYFIKWTTLHT